MSRTIDYITDPPFSGEVHPAPPVEAWTEVLRPGDLILARSVGGLVSSLIQKTDGFFTHTTIYLGVDEHGVGHVAHAYVTGVRRWDLGKLRSNYAAGALGWVRPGYGEAANLAAAEWAAERAVGGDDDDVMVQYGYDDLGLAFALLVRAMWRRRRKTTEEITDDQIEELFEGADNAFKKRGLDDLEPSTCSAFAWRAYHEGADLRILPELIEGLRVDDGLLKIGDPAAAAERSAAIRSLGDRLQRKWSTLALMASAFPGAAALFTPNRGALLSEAVSPGDLWCSPSMRARGMLIVPSADE